jgi:hypothetical protein
MSGLARIIVLLAALLGATPAFAAEVIRTFDSNVVVAKDGNLTVTETLLVRAEGRAMRHGIYRDFPLTFRDAGGTVREVTFKLLGVFRDGQAEPYHTQRLRGFIRIYAGDKNVLIRPGEHSYAFRYRTGRQVRWFDGKPELNWNVTGNYWNFPINQARYRLQLEDNAHVVRWTAFTGRRGARGIDWRGGTGSDGALTVLSTRLLSPGEGLTVVAELPASAVDAPSPNTLLWYQLFDNRQWLFGGIGFLVVLIYYFAAWEAVGRDPKGGIVIPLFHPPPGISPALANYIRDWGFAREKWRAFTAAALSLAVRGLVRFDQMGDTLMLTKTGHEPAGGFESLPPGERAIYSWVNVGGRATVDKAHGEAVAKVGTAFTTAIVSENRNRFFRRNLLYVGIGVAMTVAVVAGVIMFGGLQDSDISILVGLGFGGFVVGMLVLPTAIALFGDGAKVAVLARTVMSLAVVVIFFSIGTSFVSALFPNGFGDALPKLWSFVSGYPFPIALVTAFAALNGLFLYLMKAPTALGRPIMDQLAGFRLYLETAEADRLNLQGAPEITAERFEALLPYAVALDVEKPWAHAFEQALRRAHPGDADPMRNYQPRWSSGRGWSGSNFSGAVAASVAGVSGALASAVPASSGSSGFGGGGGGSGGGGGGGGGGGW